MPARALRWAKRLLSLRPGEGQPRKAREPFASGVDEIELSRLSDTPTAFVAIRLVPDAVEVPSDGEEGRKSIEPPIIAAEFTEDTQFFTALNGEVSEGGIFVPTFEPLPIGTELGIWFELPAGSVVDGRGRVSWIREGGENGERPGMGIAFTALSVEALDRIYEHCVHHPPLYADA